MKEQSTIFKELERLIDNNTIKLPSLPVVVANIEKAIQDDDASLQEIANIIQTEMTVSSRVLQVANSPALRGSKKITTIKDALSRIGLTMVKNIVMTIALRDKFSSKNVELNEYLFNLFERAVETSYLAYQVAKRNRGIGAIPDVAHLAGILFNLGQLPVVSYFEQKEFSSIDDVVQHADNLRADVNKILMDKWEISSSIVDAVCKEEVQSSGVDLGDVLLIVNAYLNNDVIIANALGPQALSIWKDIDDNYETDIVAVECLKLILTR